MKWFTSIRLSHKLIISLASFFVLIVLMSFYSLRQLEAINQKVHDIQSNWMPATQTLTEMRNWFNGYRAAAFQRLVAEEPWEIAYTEQDIDLCAHNRRSDGTGIV